MIFAAKKWREPGWQLVWNGRSMACLEWFFLVNFSQMENTKKKGVFLVNFSQMENTKKKGVFQVVCPCCHSLLWLDPVSQEVIQSKKGGGKKKETLDDLLLKEKKRKSAFERRFEATAELEKERKKKAEEGFRKALSKAEKED